MAIVVVDPGHGGSSKVEDSSPNNATGPTGTLEKQITLALGLALRDELAGRGHRVLLTREDDRNLGLAARAAVARQNRADAFVSIHCNGWNTPTVQGTEVWVHSRYGANSRVLASIVQQHLVDATGLADRGVKENAFLVLDPDRHDPHTAACLAEVSFLTDPAEEQRLNDHTYRHRITVSLADAIDAYLVSAHTRSDLRDDAVEDAAVWAPVMTCHWTKPRSAGCAPSCARCRSSKAGMAPAAPTSRRATPCSAATLATPGGAN
jgi:N-acetylmuramoyl-L-alanine amidase